MRLWLASLFLTTLFVGPGGSCHIPSRKKLSQRSPQGAASVVVIQVHGAITESGDDGRLFSETAGLRKLLRTFRKARNSKKVDSFQRITN